MNDDYELILRALLALLLGGALGLIFMNLIELFFGV